MGSHGFLGDARSGFRPSTVAGSANPSAGSVAEATAAHGEPGRLVRVVSAAQGLAARKSIGFPADFAEIKVCSSWVGEMSGTSKMHGFSSWCLDIIKFPC